MPVLSACWGKVVVKRRTLRIKYIQKVVSRYVDFKALFVVEAYDSAAFLL